MLHAGLPTGINWHNQYAVAVGKIAQVVSFILLFLSINHSLLHIVQASARSKQLKYYKGNWVTVEIIKMLLKNRRRSCQKCIGHLDVDEEDPTLKDIDRQDDDDWEEMYVKSKTDNNKGDEDENGHGGGNKYKDGNSGGGVDGNGNGEEEEYDNKGRNGEVSSKGVDGDGNGEEDNDNDDNEGRSSDKNVLFSIDKIQ